MEQGTRLNSSKAIYIIGSRTFGDMAGHPARAGMSQKLTDDSAVKISNSHSWGLFYTKTKTSYITYRGGGAVSTLKLFSIMGDAVLVSYSTR